MRNVLAFVALHETAALNGTCPADGVTVRLSQVGVGFGTSIHAGSFLESGFRGSHCQIGGGGGGFGVPHMISPDGPVGELVAFDAHA